MAQRATTPARLTRSRAATPAPLPALQTRQSHAYGAQGKAALQGQVTQSHDAMDQAFTITQEREATPAARPKRGRKAKTQPLVDEEPAADREEVAPSKPPPEPQDVTDTTSMNGDDMRPGTALQDSAAYQGPPPPPPPPPGRSSRVQQSAPSTRKRQHEPSRLLIFWHTLRQYLPNASLLAFIAVICTIFIGIIFFIGTIAAWAPMPSSIAAPRDQFFRGLRSAIGMPDRPPEEAEYLWLKLRHSKLFEEDVPNISNMSIQKLQFVINRNLVARVGDLENSTATLSTRVSLAEETILEMQRILPSSLAVMEENGQMVIPPTFWQALLQKVQTPESSPLWDHFLESNQARITSATQEFVENNFGEYVKSHKLVNSEDFQQAMVKSQDHMEEHFSKRLHNFQAHVLNEARKVASDVVIPKVQLETLAYFNLLRNMDARLKETNYFSIGLGAVVNPHYTSTTYNQRTVFQTIGGFFSWATGMFNYFPPKNVNSAATALLDWNEGTQCWCAAPSKDEKAMAQLAVMMPNKIHPTTIILEHIPSTGTRDIRAAPHHFEVWAQVGSAKEAKRINQELDRYVHDEERHSCEKPPGGEKDWVCLTSDIYDIHGSNHVQTFYLHTSAQELLTDKVVFRVTKNWGGDHTCLYRVRLTGSEEGLEEEYALHRHGNMYGVWQSDLEDSA